jgi:F-type H+-transporting ATPase subunit b
MENEIELAPEGGEHVVTEDGVLHGVDAVVVEHGEAATGLPQLDPGNFPNLIFWLVVSLVLLYLILTRAALPRITTALAERQDALANDLETAQLLRRRAGEAEAAYNKALADAREEANRVSAENKAAIGAELKQLMAKADAEIAAQSAESEARIREIRDSAARSVDEVARATAREIVDVFMPGRAEDAAIDTAVSNRLGA